jgi:hypothetical protein
MPDAYRLKSHPVKDQRVLALAKETTGSSCVDDLNRKGDPNGILAMSLRSALAIQEHGMRFAVTHSLVRQLSNNVHLIEFKSKHTSWRMAAYAHGEGQEKPIFVLLEPFKGHGGKTGRIPDKKIKALEEKACIAKDLIEREKEHGNL